MRPEPPRRLHHRYSLSTHPNSRKFPAYRPLVASIQPHTPLLPTSGHKRRLATERMRQARWWAAEPPVTPSSRHSPPSPSPFASRGPAESRRPCFSGRAFSVRVVVRKQIGHILFTITNQLFNNHHSGIGNLLTTIQWHLLSPFTPPPQKIILRKNTKMRSEPPTVPVYAPRGGPRFAARCFSILSPELVI